MQTWEDGHHPLPEGPGGLHAQKAGGCHQKGWQHPQVLVPMFYLLFFNSNCSINVKINMWVNFYFAGCTYKYIQILCKMEKDSRGIEPMTLGFQGWPLTIVGHS